MSYTVSYYIGHIEHQKDFTDYKSAYEYARKQWESLDSTTRDNYIGNGWNTHLVIHNGPWDEDEIFKYIF